MKSNTVKPQYSTTVCSSALCGVYGERRIGMVGSTRITFARELLSTDYLYVLRKGGVKLGVDSI